jgi:signal transduction histidine kinase
MKDLLINLLPIQDEAILFEELFDKLSKYKKINHVKWIITPTFLANVDHELSSSSEFKDAIISYFYNKSEITTYKQFTLATSIHTLSLNDDCILVPIHSFSSLHCVLAVSAEEPDKSKKLKEELSFFVYYLIVVLDRLIYTKKLKQSNLALLELNKSIEKMNQSLSKQLHIEIEKSQANLAMAEKLQENSDIQTMKKEIAHEINNPLSIFKLNLDLLSDHFIEQQIDPFILTQIEKSYQLEIGYTVKWLLTNKLINEDLSYHSFNFFELNLLKQLDDTPKLKDYIYSCMQSELTRQFIQNSSSQFEKLSTTIHNIIKHGIKLSHSKAPVNMTQLINDVCDLCNNLFQAEAITLHKEYSNSPVIIIGKKTRLYQVLINVIKNSIESLRQSPNKHITISCHKIENQFCEIIISDTGFISDTPKQSLNKSLNLGIGLKIVSAIIKEHKGDITFSHRENNQGFIVAIKIPIYSSH